MSKIVLLLYTRKGCCLCKGLEQKLLNIPLQKLNPPLDLYVIDIDSVDIPKTVRDRYDLEVPVMLLLDCESKGTFELPRVSPRINNEGLFNWLQKVLTKLIGSN